MRLTTYLVVLAALFPTTAALALDPDRQFYQYEFGGPAATVNLPSEILDVTQDQDGFLWLATARGLARYDGLEASYFRVSRYPDVLSNNPTRLFIDSKNRLFVASKRGLSMYDGNEFMTIVLGTKWATKIHAVAEDSNGTIWLGSEDGLWRLDGQQLTAAAFGEPMEHIRSLLWHGGQLIVGALGKVHIINDGASTLIDLPNAYSRAHVRDLEYHQGRIWGATRSGLFRLEGNGALPINDDALIDLSFDILLSDQDENLWFGSRSVLGRIYPNGEIELPSVEDDVFGYSPELTQMFEDALGQHWHASRFFGLTMIDDTPIERISFSEGLQSPNVTALTSNAMDIVFAATDKGIASLSGGSLNRIIDDDFSPGQSIQTMLATDDRLLWIGTERELRIYDLERDDWVVFDSTGKLNIGVNALARGTNDKIWVATDDGLYNVDQGQIQPNLETQGIAMASLLLDSSGALWLGTENGIAKMVDGKIEFQATERPEFDANVISISELPSGNIIAATVDHGLMIQNADRWVSLGENNGLPPEQLIDIEVRGQHLWVVTGAGVFRGALQDLERIKPDDVIEFQTIAAQYRYRSAHSTSCCRGKNSAAALISQGSLMTTSDDGIVILDVDISTAQDLLPRPYIKSLSYSGLIYEQFDAPFYTLNREDGPLTVDYSAVQLDRGDQVAFRYRVMGLADEWANVGESRSIVIQNPPPGDYQFELQASLSPKVWSENAVGFGFSRAPSFTETAIYPILLGAASFIAVLLLIRTRLATTRRRHHMLESEIQERTLALNELNAQLQASNRELEQSNQTDPLTGLVNRRFFDTVHNHSQLADTVARHGVLMMVDIDYFKRVNDSYGHMVGDEILCQFADVLRSLTRQSDLVVRWGGEEFMMICRCPNDDANSLLDRVCSAIREHSFKCPGIKRLNLTCSVGCIRYPLWEDNASGEQLSIMLELADAALYTVKMNGRDGWALLEGGEDPSGELQTRRVGPKMKELIDLEQLRWSSSRCEINPSIEDTVTRLRAIKLVQ